ncbi:MAG: Ig-like domain-containing protein, partial [Acidobacteriota bacterium]|nr:Ig-like domain-containing protein [Acidobacteriota bacterium]
MLLAGIYVRGSGTTPTVTAPAGWTLIRRTDQGNPVGATASVLSYFRVAGTAEPATYLWTFDRSRRALGSITSYTNVDPTAPINASGGQANSTAAAAVTAPSITTTVANTMLVGLFCLHDFATLTPPAGMTEQLDFTVANPSGMAYESADQIRSTAGATGTRSATSSFSDTSVAQLIALKPANTSVPNTPPTVSITSPISGATFTAPANVTINADASDTDGTVAKVEFFSGTNLLSTDTQAPYSYAWNNVAAGSYSLTAKATDNAGAITTSSPVNIVVNGSSGSAVATFVKIDTTTQGTWKGVYGADGYNIINDVANYPAYAQVTPSGHLAWTWTASTGDARALQKAAVNDRIAATWYSSTSF